MTWLVTVLCVGLLLLAASARAQVTLADQLIARQKVVAGTTTASSSPLTVSGLPTGLTGGILRTNGATGIGTGALVVGDIPSVFTRRDLNEVITGAWTFQGAPLTISGGTVSFTNPTANVLLWPAGASAFPTVGSRSPGTRSVVFPFLSGTQFDAATGFGPDTLWWSMATTNQRFAWFANDLDSNSEPADADLVAELTGQRDFLPGLHYSGRLGLVTRKWSELNAAALRVETLVAQDVLATVGGRVLVGPTNIMMTSMAAVASGTDPGCFRYNNFVVGDTVYFEAEGKFEVMYVTADEGGCTAPNGTLGRQYRLQRNLGGVGGGFAWDPGSGAFNTGAVGSGFMDLYALEGIKTNSGVTTSEYGPTIVGNVRTVAGNAGTAAAAVGWVPRWALGNLQGLYGYTATTYGSAFGDPTTTWVSVDATNGFRVTSGATTIGQWDTAGIITIGSAAANSTGRHRIDGDSIDTEFRGTDGILRTILSINSSLNTAGIMNVSADTYFGATVRAGGLRRWPDGNLTFTVTSLSGNVDIDTTPSGSLRPVPARDGAIPLGQATARWNNIHLQLPPQTGYGGEAISATPGSGFPYLVTGDRADNTRLGYFCGVTRTLDIDIATGTCGSGRGVLRFQCGVVTSVACY